MDNKFKAPKNSNGKVVRRNSYIIEEINKVVYNLLIAGYTNTQITEILMAEYGFNTRENCTHAILRVLKQMKEESEPEVEMLRQKYLDMYLELYKGLIASGDFKGARGVMDSIIKLQGLAVEKIEAKINTTFEIEFN